MKVNTCKFKTHVYDALYVTKMSSMIESEDETTQDTRVDQI